MCRADQHFEIRFLKIREYAERGMINMVQIGTTDQLADMLTKRLDPRRHSYLRARVMGDVAFDHSHYD